MPQPSGYLQKRNKSVPVDLWRPIREDVLDVVGEGHRLVLGHMVLNPLVDVKRTLDGILRADHQLAVCQQTSGQHTDPQLLRVVDKGTQRPAVVRKGAEQPHQVLNRS